jgi:carbonic anhydrase
MNIRLTLCLVGALVSVEVSSSLVCANDAKPQTDSTVRFLREAGLALLQEGNTRFANGQSQHPNLDAKRRLNTVTDGQEPFATVLACSDSRDPVELIFDRGVGDLFVVRVAGNVAGVSELASVEYGVAHLNTPLLVVMGHTRCGAVTAVVKGAALGGHLSALAAKIAPAADRAKAGTTNVEEAITQAIQANVWQTIADILKQSSVIREQLVAGKVHIVGALYDLEQGRVTWLGNHPAQETLLAGTEPGAGKGPHGEKPQGQSAVNGVVLTPLPSRYLLQLTPSQEAPEDGAEPAKAQTETK